ncbi:MAG: molybdopterin biosynthesis protein, partial [Tateyamaria sp.]|nr:molybdopterin biosynthesis protein [Tateyamaria sp.]
KIISYSVSEVALEDACSVGLSGLSIAAPIFETATLVETQVEEKRGTGKGQVAITGRLDRLGVQLESKIVVEHKKDQLADALKEAKGDVVFILTASATSDPLDVGPEALRKAGGVITAYGMPVDPGNLLFLGWLGKKPVIGLPGCARSPALNGADWVLERIICGQRLTQAHISSMGVGGLLKEIPTRPMPRAL